MAAQTDSTDHAAGREWTVVVTVNDQDVTIAEHRPTAAEIKTAAITAGVPIQPDFVLSRVLPNGKQKIMADDKAVAIKDGDAFWAIPGDDNS